MKRYKITPKPFEIITWDHEELLFVQPEKKCIVFVQTKTNLSEGRNLRITTPVEVEELKDGEE